MLDMLHAVIGGEAVLIRSSQIREVLRPHALTPVPVGPDHLLGLANIHGQIVCIIDAGRVTTLPSAEQAGTTHTRFLLLRDPAMHVGIQVDEVLGIRRIPEHELAGECLVQQITVDDLPASVLDCRLLLHGESTGLPG